MSVDFDRIRELIATIAATDLAEVTLKSADFELTARKSLPTAPATPLAANPTTGTGAPPLEGPATPDVPPLEPPTSRLKNEKLTDVLSPMVGTFYRAPAPGEDPFVNAGDRVRAGQTVCIIEAMKLMNEIEAEAEGEIVEICVENAEPVEYGQTLMRVRPL